MVIGEGSGGIFLSLLLPDEFSCFLAKSCRLDSAGIDRTEPEHQ
jgi:hypothetical protein